MTLLADSLSVDLNKLILNKKLNVSDCLPLTKPPTHVALYTNWSTGWHVVQRMSQTAHQL